MLDIYVIHHALSRGVCEDAEEIRLVLFYTSKPIVNDGGRFRLPRNEFYGEYIVRPEQAWDLYDLIQQGSAPETIIKTLGLGRMSLEGGERFADFWYNLKSREDHLEWSRARRDLTEKFDHYDERASGKYWQEVRVPPHRLVHGGGGRGLVTADRSGSRNPFYN